MLNQQTISARVAFSTFKLGILINFNSSYPTQPPKNEGQASCTEG